MSVTFYGRITEYTNGDKVFSFSPGSGIEGFPQTLRDLLDELGDYYGEAFKDFVHGSETCLILINGNGIVLTGGLDSPLKEGDKVEILPFVDAG